MTNWKPITLALGLVMLAGCGTMPVPQTAPITADEMEMVETARALGVDLADKAILSCTVEMYRGGYFRQYRWTPSQNGAAVAYNVEIAFVSDDTVCIVVPGNERGLMVRAQGISATGVVGPWSEWSDVVER